MHRSPSPARSASGASRSPATPTVWFMLDAALILVFAVSGRRTHERGLSVVGVLETAWPFLVAYAVAVLVVRAWRAPSSFLPTGVILWLVTAVGGLLLRALSGGGMAVSFQVVAMIALGALLLLPRLIVSARSRRRRRRRRVA